MQLHKGLQHLDVEVISGGEKEGGEGIFFQYCSMSSHIFPQRKWKWSRITTNTMWTKNTGWRKNIFPPWKHLSTWIPFFSAFLSCLWPYSYSYAERIWKQFKQLASADCFSTPQGRKREAWLMKNSLNQTYRGSCFLRGLFGHQRGFGGKNQHPPSGWGPRFSDHVCCTSRPMILYLLCIVSKWNHVSSKFCDFWPKTQWKRWEGYRECWLTRNKQKKNPCICNNNLRLFGGRIVFPSPLSVYEYIEAYTVVCSLIKQTLLYVD